MRSDANVDGAPGTGPGPGPGGGRVARQHPTEALELVGDLEEHGYPTRGRAPAVVVREDMERRSAGLDRS